MLDEQVSLMFDLPKIAAFLVGKLRFHSFPAGLSHVIPGRMGTFNF